MSKWDRKEPSYGCGDLDEMFSYLSTRAKKLEQQERYARFGKQSKTPSEEVRKGTVEKTNDLNKETQK